MISSLAIFRQTDRHPPIHTRMSEKEYPFWYLSMHYICFPHSIQEGLNYRNNEVDRTESSLSVSIPWTRSRPKESWEKGVGVLTLGLLFRVSLSNLLGARYLSQWGIFPFYFFPKPTPCELIGFTLFLLNVKPFCIEVFFNSDPRSTLVGGKLIASMEYDTYSFTKKAS